MTRDDDQARRMPEAQSCPSGADGRTFARGEDVRARAARYGLAPREAMIDLLERNIWPERFRRNGGVFSAPAMLRLLRSRALIVGCGGLGGHVAALLARLGMGAVRLCDPDVFEESNLNRQYFCTEFTLGRNKAEVTGQGLRDMASHMEVDVRPLAATPDNLPELLRDVDAAVDCLDSIPLKKSLEEAALKARVPFIHGSVLRDEGFAFLNAPGAKSETSKLARIYPRDPDQAELDAIRAEGVSATAPAGVACLMVSLLVRALLRGDTSSALLHLDYSVPDLERFDL